MNKKVICILFFLLCACVGKRNEIKFLEYKNFENIENDNIVKMVKKTKMGFCFLTLCSDFNIYDVNNFVFYVLKDMGKNQIKNFNFSDIKFIGKSYNFYIFSFRYMKIEGNIIDLKKELYEK